ncbi:tyrosine protein phosphatase [Bacillus cereus]|nr:tyrosine protein phosphatase [Bacillus cereus]
MIDLHCHILPSIDDGAKTLNDSLAMAEKAVSEGIYTIVATPHHLNGKYTNERLDILYGVNRLNEELKRNKIPLNILPGQEVRVNRELLDDYKLGKVATLNEMNKYLLVEFPTSHVPYYVEKLFYDLQLEGIIPVIAHPERNIELFEEPTKLFKLVKSGALTQVTAGSLLGVFGKRIQKFSIKIIEHHLAHIIASDAHNVTTRLFHLQEGYELIEKKFGIKTAENFRQRANSIIRDKGMYLEAPQKISIKNKFWFFNI